MIKGRSLELFFIDGRPDGMLAAEVFNWTGHVLRIPRTQIREGLNRPEAKQSGIYILLGEKDADSYAYIGEAEKLSERIKDHISKKEWWDIVILVTTTGDLLHKAHIKYLEARLFEMASQVGAVHLDNNNTPTKSSLSEAATANMEGFLETLGMVLPAIRVDVFQQKAKPKTVKSNTAASALQALEFTLEAPKSGVKATAELIDGELVVKVGSCGRKSWVGNAKHANSYQKLREQLLTAGVLEIVGDSAIFTVDYAFNSPSAAAAILRGRAANGRVEWKLKHSTTTYAQWEESNIKNEEDGTT